MSINLERIMNTCSCIFFLQFSKIAPLLLMLLVSSFCYSQYSTLGFLDTLNSKLNAIKNGKYHVRYQIKKFSKNDTIFNSGSVSFIRDSSNPGFQKPQYVLSIDNVNEKTMNDGKLQISYAEEDSIIFVETDSNRFSRGNIRFELLYDPLLKFNYFHDLVYSSQFDSMILKETNAEFRELILYLKDDSSTGLENMHFSFLISRTDLLPVRKEFYVEYSCMYQYSRWDIDSIEKFNERIRINLDSLGKHYAIITLDDSKEIKKQLITKGPFPLWRLESIDRDTMSSVDLRGKLVFYDFWYKSCYPCIKSIPAIQKLYEKYSHQGFQVIGLNPYDFDLSDLDKFLNLRVVTYPNLVGAKPLAQQLNVYGYPSYFLVDKNNQIVYSGSGYSEQLENILEEKIKQQLDIK